MHTHFVTPAFGLSLLLAAAPIAHADEPADEPTPAPSTPAEAARARDASIDRGFLTAHAETIGDDRWAINAYELIFIGLTYGFSDDVQASLSTLLPVTTDIPLVLALQPKFVLSRSPSTIVALRTPVTFVHDDGESFGTAGAGLLVDHYLSDDGRVALHFGLLASSAFGSAFDVDNEFELREGAFFELDLGLTFGVTRAVKLLIEVQTLAGADKDGFEISDVWLINYGVRFHGESLAGDVGFIRPVGVDTDPLLLGVPYLAFSARF